jgi:hypothetical protein
MRSIKLPRPPPLPDQLPFEDAVGRMLDRAAQALERSPITRAARRIEEGFPEIEAVEVPTPLGTITTPYLQLPALSSPPQMDKRRREAIKAAVGEDLANLVSLIPYVGFVAAPLTDAVEDTFSARIQELLTTDELKVFREKDKVSPSTAVSALLTFAKRR